MIVSFKIPQKLEYLIWALTICIWIAEALATTKSLNSDAVAYFNMADAYLAGDWHGLINGWWSPAYPFLLAMVLKLEVCGKRGEDRRF